MLMLFVRYIKFAGTSVIGTLADTLVLWLLSDYVFSGGYWGQYIISPALSFQCAVTVNFIISYFYVWKDRTRKRPDSSVRKFFKLYAAYILSSTAVFLLRLGALLLIERFTGWDVVICNLLSMGFSGILNFAINNLMIFKKKNSQSPPKIQ